jgi:hypothetical protein
LRWLVCGGRDFGKSFDEKCWLENMLEELAEARGWPSHIIQGGASGVDTCARVWAVYSDTPYTEYPAQWSEYGKSAGFIRNKRMLDEGKPDLVVAFPGGKGTKMMVELAKKAGVEVIEYGRGP